MLIEQCTTFSLVFLLLGCLLSHLWEFMVLPFNGWEMISYHPTLHSLDIRLVEFCYRFHIIDLSLLNPLFKGENAGTITLDARSTTANKKADGGKLESFGSVSQFPEPEYHL